MGKRERTWAIIPPYIPNILLGYVCIRWGMIRCQEYLLDLPELMLFTAGALLVVGGCMHCTILPNGLLVQFLWIPYRFIRWDNIGNAEYVTQWFRSRDSDSEWDFRYSFGGIRFRKWRSVWQGTGPAWVSGCGIFVTTANCPGYFSGVDSMLLFRLKHPVGAMFFRFLPLRRRLYRELFLRYYPELELPVEEIVAGSMEK